MMKRALPVLCAILTIISWFIREKVSDLIVSKISAIVDPQVVFTSEYGPPAIFAILFLFLMWPTRSQKLSRREMISIISMSVGSILLIFGISLYRYETGSFPFWKSDKSASDDISKKDLTQDSGPKKDTKDTLSSNNQGGTALVIGGEATGNIIKLRSSGFRTAVDAKGPLTGNEFDIVANTSGEPIPEEAPTPIEPRAGFPNLTAAQIRKMVLALTPELQAAQDRIDANIPDMKKFYAAKEIEEKKYEQNFRQANLDLEYELYRRLGIVFYPDNRPMLLSRGKMIGGRTFVDTAEYLSNLASRLK